MTGSAVSNDQSRRSSWSSASGAWSTSDSGMVTQDTIPSIPDIHLISRRSVGRSSLGLEHFAIQQSTATQAQDRSDLEQKPPPSSAPAESSAHEPVSLADQYLDTMVMDDTWRAACITKILQTQRKQLALKRLSKRSTKRRPRLSTATNSAYPLLKASKKAYKTHSRHDINPLTPPVSPRAAYRAEHSSSPSSDSGFISSSPTPSPSRPLRMRSTRNCPISNPSASTSIDVPASMVGRSCLSCGCTNTTCWRRTLGGIICNSCGLRLTIYSLAWLMVGTRNAGLFVQM
jgi:hypothetical protein